MTIWVTIIYKINKHPMHSDSKNDMETQEILQASKSAANGSLSTTVKEGHDMTFPGLLNRQKYSTPN
jgi:hypothetical protein